MQALLKEKYHYNPKTGVFTFRHDTSKGKIKAGDEAGTVDGRGRRTIYFQKKLKQASHMAVLYMENKLPSFVRFIGGRQRFFHFEAIKVLTHQELKTGAHGYNAYEWTKSVVHEMNRGGSNLIDYFWVYLFLILNPIFLEKTP